MSRKYPGSKKNLSTVIKREPQCLLEGLNLDWKSFKKPWFTKVSYSESVFASEWGDDLRTGEQGRVDLQGG